MKKGPLVELAPACRDGNVLASAKFLKAAYFFYIMVLPMLLRPIRSLPRLMLQNYCAATAARREPRASFDHSITGHISA
jgi:hypothetical protein